MSFEYVRSQKHIHCVFGVIGIREHIHYISYDENNMAFNLPRLAQIYFKWSMILFISGLKTIYNKYPKRPPIVFVIKSVISAARKPLISGWVNSIPKLNKNAQNRMDNIFCFFTTGSKNPNGIIIITLRIIWRTVSPLPEK
jgi:hypothetical protein